MNQQIEENDKRALTMRDKLIAISPSVSQNNTPQDPSSPGVNGNSAEVEREVVVTLQQFVITTSAALRRANQLNLYLFNAIPYNGPKPFVGYQYR